MYVRPAKFLLVEGLLNFHTETLRTLHDVRVALAPPEELRRAWKLKRDCTRRGYTTDEVLAELDARQADAEEYVQPQRRYADIVVAFSNIGRSGAPRRGPDPARHAAAPGPVAAARTGAARRSSSASASGCCGSPANLDPGHAAELEEAVWERMSFAVAPAHPAARRVHRRHRPAPLRLARARAAPDPVPRGHGAGRALDRRLAAARRSALPDGRGLGFARLAVPLYVVRQHMAVTLTQLVSFLTVVRRGSVTAAAEELVVTQPSVSAAVSALERELGVRLTERAGRTVRPDAGGRGVRALRRPTCSACSTRARARRARPRRRGRRRCGSAPSRRRASTWCRS